MTTSLPPSLARLARDGRIDLADAESVSVSVGRQELGVRDAELLLARYAELLDPGAQQVLSRLTGAPSTPQRRLPESLLTTTVDKTAPPSRIEALQRGLLALARARGDGELVPSGGVTGVYDVDTERAVRALQQKAGLPRTGVADPTTLAVIQRDLRDEPGGEPVGVRPSVSPLTTERALRRSVSTAGPPAPHEAIAAAAKDGRIDVAELQDLHARSRRGDAGAPTAEQLAELPARYAEALPEDARRYLTSLGHPAPTARELLPDAIKGKTLERGQASAHVEALQRGLMAVARLGETPALALADGASGRFDAATAKAVQAFQKKVKLPPTGVADPATLEALQAELGRLHRVGYLPPTQPATPELLAARAWHLAEGPESYHYGATKPWVNLDPRHTLPVGQPITALEGAWKCNLFVCNAMVSAGFEPPYYGNQGHGEYPNANKLALFSDKHGPREGNRVHFQMREELRLDRVPIPEREARIKVLYDRIEPGDLVIVDHVGGAVQNGGHCRIAVERDWDGAWRFAQAATGRAAVLKEEAVALSREAVIWVMKPTMPRR